MISFFLYTIGLILGLLIFFIFIKPLYKLLLLKIKYRDEILILFYPLNGLGHHFRQNEKRYGQPYHELRQIITKNPKLKAIAWSLGFNVCITSIDPNLSKSIFLQNYDKAEKLFPVLNPNFIKNGLVLQEGEDWKRCRKMIAESFHCDNLKTRFQLICQISHKKIQDLQKYIGKDYFPVFDEMTNLSGELAIRALFGPDFGDYKIDGVPISKALASLLEEVFMYSETSISYQLKRSIIGAENAMKFLTKHEKSLVDRENQFLDIAIQEIEKRIDIFKQNSDFQSDFLIDRLVKEYLNNSQSGLTKDKIAQQCITFFFAALETTGNLLGWLLTCIAEHKDEGQQVINEINKIFPNQETVDNMKFDDINKLTYMTAFIEESQRNYNSAAGSFVRIITQPFEAENFSFKKGDFIQVSYFCHFFNPKYFEKPEEFNVNRFLNGNSKNIHPYAFTPFSAGPRSCIGKHLALLEIKITLIQFVKLYKIERNNQVRLRFKKGIIFKPEDQNLIKISPK